MGWDIIEEWWGFKAIRKHNHYNAEVKHMDGNTVWRIAEGGEVHSEGQALSFTAGLAIAGAQLESL